MNCEQPNKKRLPTTLAFFLLPYKNSLKKSTFFQNFLFLHNSVQLNYLNLKRANFGSIMMHFWFKGLSAPLWFSLISSFPLAFCLFSLERECHCSLIRLATVPHENSVRLCYRWAKRLSPRPASLSFTPFAPRSSASSIWDGSDRRLINLVTVPWRIATIKISCDCNCVTSVNIGTVTETKKSSS